MEGWRRCSKAEMIVCGSPGWNGEDGIEGMVAIGGVGGM